MPKIKKQPKILFASYECAPFFKFGGLGDVAGSLPKALKESQIDIRVVMPLYKSTKEKYGTKLKPIKTNLKFEFDNRKINWHIFASKLPHSKVPIYFIGNKEFFEVKNIFNSQERTRFILFSHLISQLPEMLKWQPDIIHCNDWQTAMVPLLVKRSNYFQNTKTLFTIHNIGYAGRTKLSVLEKFGWHADDFSEIKNSKVNLMKEAILNADKVSTVSPNYAQEILTKKYGYDMAPALKRRKQDLLGIINGLDYHIFDPNKDKNIKFKYSPKNLIGKTKNKLHLQKFSGLAQDENIPVIGMVSRLVSQKGFDLLEKIFDKLMRENIQLIILGTGNKRLENFLALKQKGYPNKFKAHLLFNLKLASQIYAGADMFLMPSKYEPCGLGQLIAMKYGTVPIVRFTGGLKDTVKQGKTGFGFKPYQGAAMLKSINQAIKYYGQPKKWRALVKNCMHQDFSWQASARRYSELYKNEARN